MATKKECDNLKEVMNADKCKVPKSDECKNHFADKLGVDRTHDMNITITRCERRCEPYQEYGNEQQQVCDLISAIKENQKKIQDSGSITTEGIKLGGIEPHHFFYDRNIAHVFDNETFKKLEKQISLHFKLINDEEHSENEAITNGKSLYSSVFTKQNKKKTYVLVSPFRLELLGKPCSGGFTIPMGSTKAVADLICSKNKPNETGIFKKPSRFGFLRGGKRSNRKGKKVSRNSKKGSKRSKNVSRNSKNSRKTSKTKKVGGGNQNRIKKTNKK